MGTSKHNIKIILAAIIAIFITCSAILGKKIDGLSGSDLLKAVRQKTPPKPSYTERNIKPKPSETEPLTTVIEEKLTEPTPQTVEPQEQIEPQQPVQPQIESAVIGDEMLKIIPADSMFCVRINNLDYTLGLVDQFISGLSPMPIGTNMMVRMGLAEMLGDAQLKGLNTGSSFAVFGTYTTSNPDEPPSAKNLFVAAVLPISNLKQFSTDNNSCAPPDSNGISTITSKSMSGQQKSFIITQTGNYCLLTIPEYYDKLTATAKSFSSGQSKSVTTAINAEQTKLAAEQPIWAYGNIELAGKTFSPFISAQFEQLRSMMLLQMQQQGQQNPEFIAKIMNIYAVALKTFLTQSKFVCITVNPDPNTLKISETLQALPNTTLADMFTNNTAALQKNNLLGYLEDDAFMNIAFKNTPISEQLAAKYFELIKDILPDVNQSSFISNMKDQTESSDFSVASVKLDTNSTMSFSAKTVTHITNIEKFKNYIEKSHDDLMNKQVLNKLFNNFGVDCNFIIQKNASKYKNVNIDSIKLALKTTDLNSPTGKAINAFYGEGFDVRNAIAKNLSLATIGSNCDSDMQQLIDVALAGGPRQISPGIKTALQLAPQAESADFFMTLNFIRYMEMALRMIQKTDPNIKTPQFNVQSKSNFVFTGTSNNGSVKINIILPKQHVLEMTSVMAQFQQVMMQQQQMNHQRLQKQKQQPTTEEPNNQETAQPQQTEPAQQPPSDANN